MRIHALYRRAAQSAAFVAGWATLSAPGARRPDGDGLRVTGREKGLRFFDARTPFFGLPRFSRLPADAVSPYGRVISLHNSFPAGRALSFITDAPFLEVRALFSLKTNIPYMSIAAVSGLDVYTRTGGAWAWKRNLSTRYETQMSFRERVELGGGDREVLIFLPPYARISRLLLGFPESASVRPRNWDRKPIAFYGSSITQGCAASRPGLSFPNVIARRLDCPIVNVGFSESARAQEGVVSYFSGLSAAAFVVEYDHNATVEELRNTHRGVYDAIRRKNPDAPIVFLSRLSGGMSVGLEEERARVDIIRATVCAARKARFLCGRDILDGFSGAQGDLFVDDRHPNDAGMALIAERVLETLAEMGGLWS
ncbi:MAG: hypothetical protein IJQ25_05740 [Oscillibacter sp.]|nr:hypothetical protein [Oscillibacter sp.]